MACLPSWLRTEYESQLAAVINQITNAETALEAAFTNSEVEEYSLNTGEGSQRTKRRNVKELEATLERLYARKLRLMRKLYGYSVVNLNMRRKQYDTTTGRYNGPV